MRCRCFMNACRQVLNGRNRDCVCVCVSRERGWERNEIKFVLNEKNTQTQTHKLFLACKNTASHTLHGLDLQPERDWGVCLFVYAQQTGITSLLPAYWSACLLTGTGERLFLNCCIFMHVPVWVASRNSSSLKTRAIAWLELMVGMPHVTRIYSCWDTLPLNIGECFALHRCRILACSGFIYVHVPSPSCFLGCCKTCRYTFALE